MYRIKSLPARGAWIEIFMLMYMRKPAKSLPARGAWIEIICSCRHYPVCRRRSPHGERGLK